MKILIAEDDSKSRNNLFDLLSQYGECDLVIDGMETMDAYLISLMENDPYDLIYLNMFIPKVEGIKILKAIRDIENQRIKEEYHSTVIISSLLENIDEAEKIFDIGIDGYIIKPIKSERVLALLNELSMINKIKA